MSLPAPVLRLILRFAVVIMLFAFVPPAHASPFKNLDRVLQTMGKTSDDMAANIAKMLKNTDLDWSKALRRDGILKESEALARLRKIPGLNHVDGAVLKNLDGAGRHALVSLLEESHAVLKTGLDQGLSPDVIVSAIQKGGPEAIYGIRSMKSGEGAADCILGFSKYGDSFNSFVRQADEAPVRTLMKHADEIPPAKLKDILENPTKYFDAAGKPKRAFESMFVPASSRAFFKKGVVAGVVAVILFLPEKAIDVIEQYFGKEIADFLRAAQWYLIVGVSLFLIWYFWPILRPVFGWLCRAALRGLARFRGVLGRWAQNRLSAVELRESRKLKRAGENLYGIIPPSPKPEIHLGLLGSRRVGKSTFITMLTEKLGELVEGAGLKPADGKNKALLDQIKSEVETGRPTGEKKDIVLDLVWPYTWGNTESGHFAGLLHLTDYPGENACADAASEEFRGLAEYLRKVDGLFVVIDPTDLELRDEGNRVKSQREVIDQMFNEDGLDLGHEFKRSLCVLITKRDVINRDWLAKNRPSGMTDGEFDETVALAGKKRLSSDESADLGRRIFKLLYPDAFAYLWNKLSPEHGKSRESRREWFRRPQSPQFEVFAVSQLGFELGRRANELLAEKQRKNKDAFDKPLNLEEARADDLDFQHPFAWMFDSLPAGWLNEINSRSSRAWGIRGTRRRTHKRFCGAPAVRQDAKVGWTRFSVALLILVGAVFVGGKASTSIQTGMERSMARQRISDVISQENPPASAAEYKQAIAAIRRMSTKPVSASLDKLRDMIDLREEAEEIESQLRETPRDDPRRLDLLDKWFVVYGSLPGRASDNFTNPGNEAIDELNRYREIEKGRMIANVRDYVDSMKENRDRLCRLGTERGYLEAIARNQTCLRKIASLIERPEVGDGLDASEKEAEEIRASTDDRYFDWAFAKNRDMVREYREKKEFAKAIRLIREFTTTQTSSVIQLKANELRETCIREYWGHVSEEVKAKSESEFGTQAYAEASDSVRQFKKTLDLSEDDREKCDTLLDELVDRHVLYMIQVAERNNDRSDYAKASETLDSISTLYEKCDAGTRQRWIITLVKSKIGQRQFSEAILALQKHPSPDSSGFGFSDLWREWANIIDKEVPSAIAGEDYAKAEQMLNHFDTEKSHQSCPPEIRERIENARKEWDRDIKIGSAVARAKADTSALELEARLGELKSRADECAKSNNIALCKKWYKTVLELHDKLGNTAGKTAFLKNLDKDLKDKLDISDEEIRGARQENINSIIRKYEESIREGRPDEAWSRLASQRRSLDSESQKMLDDFIKKKIDADLSELAVDLTKSLNASDFEKANRQVREAEDRFGDLIFESKFNLRESLDASYADVATKQVDDRIGKIGKSDDYKTDYDEIKSILSDKTLQDDKRMIVTSKREVVLTKWEKRDFESVYGAWSRKDYVLLLEKTSVYLDERQPYSGRRGKREEAAQAIKLWLESFENTRRFTLAKIRYKDMPPASWSVSNYDPVFRVTIACDHKEEKLETPMAKDLAGSGAIESFSSPTQFRWKKGGTITIRVWQDKLDTPNYCIGAIESSGDYALLELAHPEMFHEVVLEDYKNNGDFKDSAFSLGLTVTGLDVPDLKEHDQYK